ncbi:MAG: DUF4115 domain-containing protein [Alphaproteobacteria bacterium]|nr:DUF4115 domain-containing protein [Alphaproteobacteria bacterium]
MTEEFQEPSFNTEMTAGEMLRVARTTGRRKREISTISKQLCIREEFLQALEDGDYTVLPELVYILGFARNYAMELGLDPDVIVSKIKREMGVYPTDLPIIHQNVAEPVDQNRLQIKEKIGKNFKQFKDSKSCKFVVKYWKWFLGAIVLLALVGGIVGVLMATAQPEDPAAPVEIIVPTPANSEPEYRQTVRERFGTENRADAEIVLQAFEESWVKIEDARGKTVFSRVLVPGDLYYVPSGNKNKATFGNVGGVDIWVRGELVPKAGNDHTRKTGIVLDPDVLTGKSSDKDTKKDAENSTKKTTDNSVTSKKS